MSHHQPDPNISVNLTIDGMSVTVPEGTRILEAAKKVNVHIPTLCEHPELCKRAWCRICVVECDGRGKLAAACATDVWEGVSVVTNNQRLAAIRKTILELILANHPQDCLSCIRSRNCELQSLAASFGLNSSSSFRNNAEKQPPVIESETIVRNMNKCVKCGRCVEACQEIQAIRVINTSRRSCEFEISAAYGQALKDGSCVFCGQCASVCPVGAIYEYDQTAEVWAAINDGGLKTIAQVSPVLAAILDKELGLAAGAVTAGKMAAAIRRLGFDRVYDADITANAADAEISGDIQRRKNSGGDKLPVISGCSEGIASFIRNFYPDLADHLSAGKNPRQIFAARVKADYAKETGIDLSGVASVSFVPCLAQKYRSGEKDKTDYALTAKELARMVKQAGIVIEALPEESFDAVGIDLPAVAEKKETVYGFAEARKTIEAIRNGECKAGWLEILSCPAADCVCGR